MFVTLPADCTAENGALQVRSGMELALICRFFVTWRDPDTDQQHFLEDLSADEDDNVTYFLFLGVDDDSGELLFYVHLPLKINAGIFTW